MPQMRDWGHPRDASWKENSINMTDQYIKVLLVEDDEDDFVITCDMLSEIEWTKFDVEWASDYDAAMEAITRNAHDVYLIDYRLGKRSGLELLREVIGNGCEGPFILLTGQGDHEVDLLAMEAGAADYLVKGQIGSSSLERSIRYAIDRRRAQRALQKSEEMYRLHFENVGDVIYSVDRNFSVTSISPSVQSFVGYEPAELIGRKIDELDFFSCAYREQAIENATRVMEGEHVGPTEYEFTAKNGEKKLGEIVASPLFKNGEVTAALAVARDITEQRQLEDQLRQAQKMQAIGQLAGGVAHDFNNLLTGILGYISFAMNSIDETTSCYEDLKEAKQCAVRAAELVSKLLAFSRKHPLRLVCIDLNGTVLGLTAMLRRLIGEHIELKVKINPDPILIHGDAHQLEQVIINICVNARDAMPGGGILSIETSVKDIDEQFCSVHPGLKPGRHSVLSVRDNGVGIDEKTIGLIFDPFFTTKEVGKGTGLGLSMVYGIVRQHKGEIIVSSELEKGSTFDLYFPAADAGTFWQKKGEEKSALPRNGNGVILLAEDDQFVRKTILRILEQGGYTILTADNGEDALRIFEDNKDRISMAILDMVMPKMCGQEVYDIMRNLRPDLKVLLISGYMPDTMLDSVKTDYGIDFLMKPFKPDNVLDKVNNALCVRK